MGSVVVSQFITLDGVMEDPGGSEGTEIGGWAFQFDRGSDGDKFKLDELMHAEALLLGRVTYDGYAAAWPERTDEEGFAEKFNTMPKYVVSTTLKDPSWNNSSVISGDLTDAVADLKRSYTGDILVNGSRQLVSALRSADLVDEYRLLVYPVVLGAGKRLFEDAGVRTDLRLVESTPVGECVILTFQPAHADGTS